MNCIYIIIRYMCLFKRRNIIRFTAFFLILLPVSDNLIAQEKMQICSFPDIRQVIRPEGFTHFVNPFHSNYIHGVYNSQEQVLCCYDDHMMVYDKAQHFWQVFSGSDGYLNLALSNISARDFHRTFFEDYDDFIVCSVDGRMRPRADSMKIINLFDKRKGTLTPLSYPEYADLKKGLQNREFNDPDFTWYTEPGNYSSVFRKNKNSGQVSNISARPMAFNDYLFLGAQQNLLFAGGSSGIRIFIDNTETEPLHSINGVYNDKITGINTGQGKLYIICDSVIDAFDPRSRLLISRYKPGESVTQATEAEGSLYYSTGNRLCRFDPASGKSETIMTLIGDISSLSTIHSYIVAGTSSGITCYDPVEDKAVHYFNNTQAVEEEEEYYDDYYGDIYKTAGINGEIIYLQVISSNDKGVNRNRLIALNLPSGMIQDIILPPKETEILAASSLVKIENGALLLVNGDTLSVYTITGEKTMQLKKAAEIITENEDIPGLIPSVFIQRTNRITGEKIMHAAVSGDKIWVITDLGLYSADMNGGNCRSYFSAAAGIHCGTELIVTDDAIYSHGYWTSGISWPWSKIERKTGKSELYVPSSRSPEPVSGSFRIHDQEMICATSAGLLRMDLKTLNAEVIKTPEPIVKTAFYNQGYLAAGKKAIYMIGNDKSVKKMLDLPVFKNYKAAYTSSALPLHDPPFIWIEYPLFQESHITGITRFCPGSGEMIKYMPLNGLSEYNLFPGADENWIITEQAIYRFDKKSGELRKVISIPEVWFKPNGAMHEGELIYIPGSQGLYAFSTRTLSMQMLDIPFIDGYYPSIIRKSGSMVFFSTANGIMQFHTSVFGKYFRNLYLPRDYKFHRDLVLPYNYRGNIAVKPEYEAFELCFDVIQELKQQRIPEIGPGSLKAYLNNNEIKLYTSVLNEDYTNAVYGLKAEKTAFREGPAELSIVFTNDSGEETVLARWIIATAGQ